jgi:hypothetical protein
MCWISEIRRPRRRGPDAAEEASGTAMTAAGKKHLRGLLPEDVDSVDLTIELLTKTIAEASSRKTKAKGTALRDLSRVEENLIRTRREWLVQEATSLDVDSQLQELQEAYVENGGDPDDTEAAVRWAMRTGKRPVEVFGRSLYRLVSIRVAVDPRFVVFEDGRFDRSDKSS